MSSVHWLFSILQFLDDYFDGLVFYTEENEIARIGRFQPNAAAIMIDLADGEILCGVSASRGDGGLPTSSSLLQDLNEN